MKTTILLLQVNNDNNEDKQVNRAVLLLGYKHRLVPAPCSELSLALYNISGSSRVI